MNYEAAIQNLILKDEPCFIFDETELIQSTQAIRTYWRSVAAPDSQVLFSVKANPNPHILQIIERYSDGFDVSSLAELSLVKNKVNANAVVTWSGPAKTDLAIQEMLRQKIHCCHVDSYDELVALQNFETKLGVNIKKSIRLQRVEASSKKLGFSQRELDRLSSQQWQRISGFHQYFGRDEFNMSFLHNYLEQIQLLSSRCAKTPDIYLGPGLPTASHLNRIEAGPIDPKPIAIECGRAIVQSCGTYLTRIKHIEVNKSGQRIIVEGGRNHFGGYWPSPRFGYAGLSLKFWRNGLLEGSTQYLSDEQTTEPKDFIIGDMGTTDTIWEGVLTTDSLRAGDWISFSHCGGYGVTAASQQWAKNGAIKEWLLSVDGGLKCISPPRMNSYLHAGVAQNVD